MDARELRFLVTMVMLAPLIRVMKGNASFQLILIVGLWNAVQMGNAMMAVSARWTFVTTKAVFSSQFRDV